VAGLAELDPPSRYHRPAARTGGNRAGRGEQAAAQTGGRVGAGQRHPSFCECVFRLGARPDPEVIVRFVKDSRYPVELVLRVLGIASSTYYWTGGRTSPATA
jgi:hypothetical protein